MMNQTSLLIAAILILASCTDEQQEFVHSIKNTEGITNGVIAYAHSDYSLDNQNDSAIFLSEDLKEGDINISRVEGGEYVIVLADDQSKTIFTKVPSKYINLDASVEVTRNVFQDYFLEDWEPMKGTRYSTIYIKSKKSQTFFYMKTVYTGTDKEIGMYSEDY